MITLGFSKIAANFSGRRLTTWRRQSCLSSTFLRHGEASCNVLHSRLQSLNELDISSLHHVLARAQIVWLHARSQFVRLHAR